MLSTDKIRYRSNTSPEPLPKKLNGWRVFHKSGFREASEEQAEAAALAFWESEEEPVEPKTETIVNHQPELSHVPLSSEVDFCLGLLRKRNIIGVVEVLGSMSPYASSAIVLGLAASIPEDMPDDIMDELMDTLINKSGRAWE